MTLFEKIEKIQYDNNINASGFIAKTGFSRGLYYSIKSGDKTELKPNQMRTIVNAFPKVDIEWLNNSSVFSTNKDSNVYEGEVFLEKEGIRFELIELVDHFIKNKDAYLEQSEYLKLFLNKHIELGVKARFEELGYKVTIVKN